VSAVTDFIVSVNDVYWYGVIALLVGAGLYFSVTTLIVQIRMFPEMLKTIVEKPSDIEEDKKGISAFRAFTISAASRVGTGNVAGVAIAITVGGPGAVFWMWLLAIIGGATAFIESTLAQLYKVKGRDSYVGGPAYYIRDGLGWKPVAVLFAVIITVTYGFVFNAVQANSIAQSVRNQFSLEGFAPGLIIGHVADRLRDGADPPLVEHEPVEQPLSHAALAAAGQVVGVGLHDEWDGRIESVGDGVHRGILVGPRQQGQPP